MTAQPPPPSGWPPGQPARPGTVTLVGGLPWQSQPPGATPPVTLPIDPAAVSPMPVAIGPIRPVASTAPTRRIDIRGHWLTKYLNEEDVVHVLNWPATARAKLNTLVRQSPPLTVSLSMHVVVLLALALWMVRHKKEDKVQLELAFASPIVSDKPSREENIPVKIEKPEPEPEVAVTKEPPVPDPVAAPPKPAEVAETPGGAIGKSAAPVVGTLLDGRQEGRRSALVVRGGGSDTTEAAVARALQWIVRQQGKDGLWSLSGPYSDGGSQENRLAATAMALLALQGAGNTTQEGRHQAAVAKGWKGLLATQLPDGRFDVTPVPTHHALYSHAQATIAVCEAYGMTKDPAFAVPAKRAIDFAVLAQGPNGAWRYEPRKEGDMSVTGWYMMALKSAEMAGVDFPTQTLAALNRFLDTVAVDDGKRYGYRFEGAEREVDPKDPLQRKPVAGPVTAAVSAEGLLCRQYLGWPRNEPRLVAGLELLFASAPIDFDNEKDVYAWYYITQVAHHLGGEPWKRWNERLSEVLPAKQVQRGPEAGSWDPSLDRWGPWGGRLFMTCFCTYMLEVYYRHLPIYDDGEAASR